MTDTPNQLEELLDRLDRVCNGNAGSDDLARIEELARADKDLCWAYISYSHLHAALRWGPVEMPSSDAEAEPVPLADQMPITDGPTSNSMLGFPTFLSTTLPNTVGYLSSGWPLAYLMATVIFGIGLLIGSLVHVSQPVQVARQSVPLPSPLSPLSSVVGRITGMFGCRWANPSTAPVGYDRISLGRQFQLDAGLMEITYDTGAKVILQGPVTYEVESKDGGFLAVGKLTAKLEKKAEGPNAQSPTPNPSFLSTIHDPLFTIKTPTATVTDLGTEFGLEVRESGATSARVFRGIVEVQPAANDGEQQGRAVRLIENESVQVERSNGNGGLTVRRERIDAAAFVRAEQLPKLAAEQRFKAFHRWQAYSQQLRRDPSLLAYYDFQLEEGKPAVLRNVAAHGDRALDGVVENATWSTGRMSGKHALLFNGPSDYVSVNLPQKTDDLTLAAWICIDSLAENPVTALLASTGWLKPGQVHWQMARDGHLGLGCTSNSLGNCDTAPVISADRLHRWIHVACVYDHAAGRVRFYVDGQNVGGAEYHATGPITIGPACIGNWDHDVFPNTEPRNFFGRMDELAVFGRPLSADEAQHMYERGKP